MASVFSRDGAEGFSLATAKSCTRRFLPIEAAEEIDTTADLLRVWRESKRDGTLPSKRVIDPLTLAPKTLSHIVLVDVERDPLRFRYRLTGTAVDRVQNRNLTGSYVDENRPESLRDLLLADLTKLTRDWEPQLAELTFTNRTGHPRQVVVLRLALSAPEGPADRADHLVLVFEAPE